MKTNIPRYKNYSPRKLNITRGDKIFPAEMKCKNILPTPKYSSQPKDFPRGKKSSPRPRNYSPRQNYSPWPRKHSPRKKYSPRPRKYSPRPRKYSPRKKYSPRPTKYSPRQKKYSFLCPSQASVFFNDRYQNCFHSSI